MNATPMTAADGTELWVVVSSQGEYSDRRESVVCACPDAATAQAYAEAADHRAREIEATMKADGVHWWVPPAAETNPRYRSVLDPERGSGFTYSEPTTYYVSKAPLRLSVPTPTGRAEG